MEKQVEGFDLCLDNLICCDDNCNRCANLIYQRYKEMKKELEITKEYIHHNGLEWDLLSFVKRRED